jgi:hypothetical protein
MAEALMPKYECVTTLMGKKNPCFAKLGYNANTLISFASLADGDPEATTLCQHTQPFWDAGLLEVHMRT